MARACWLKYIWLISFFAAFIACSLLFYDFLQSYQDVAGLSIPAEPVLCVAAYEEVPSGPGYPHVEQPQALGYLFHLGSVDGVPDRFPLNALSSAFMRDMGSLMSSSRNQ